MSVHLFNLCNLHIETENYYKYLEAWHDFLILNKKDIFFQSTLMTSLMLLFKEAYSFLMYCCSIVTRVYLIFVMENLSDGKRTGAIKVPVFCYVQ